jgi:ABC-type uncharacterized transport system involved in gliding motility auxiliary subunit
VEQKTRALYSTGSIALLAVLFVALVILSGALLRGWRIDLTENRQYTLSEGTLNILASLQEPVKLQLFFSEEASRELPQIRTYARRVTELIEEMVERGNGRLSLERIDPRPFSPEEDQAAQFGLQAVPVPGGDTLYFGLAGTNSLDDLQTMPFLMLDKEQFLEYDLAKMISTLSVPEQKKVGLLSSLDMAPGFDPATQGFSDGWVIYEQLDQLFDLEQVPVTAEELPEDLDLLFLVHPRELNERLQYQIDQFVLRGGRLVAFLDPFAEADVGGNPNDPMARFNAGSSSTLEPLLGAWGVRYDPTRVIGDLLYALQVSLGGGRPPSRHLGILSVTRDGLNGEDIVSADLEAVNWSSVGWFEPAEEATTRFQPLAETSENAAPLDASRLRFLSDPADLLSGFQPTGDHYALAARISGPARSAFTTVPEGEDATAHAMQSAEGGVNVLLFADTDLLTDRFWVQKQNFFGQTLTTSFADNGTLVVNAVDNLLGASDLISIRTRTTSARPFERVEALRLQAESQFRATEEQLQRELQETESKLSEMQSARQDGNLTVLSEEQQAEIQRFMDQRLQIRRDLRDVRHDLDREIDRLGTRLKMINMGLVPALVVVFALLFGRHRQRRRAGGVK